MTHGHSEYYCVKPNLAVNRLLAFVLAQLPVFFVVCPYNLSAQNTDRLENVLIISGYESEEALGEEVFEHFEYLERKPVEINLVPYSKLLSCGLFSQYQAMSLRDYIARYGDVLSIEELSNVEGFGASYARALKPYIDLYSSRVAGSVRKPHSSATLSARASYKNDKISYKGKSTYSYGDIAGIALSYSPDAFNISMALQGRRVLDKLLIGDFNARFAQGLVLWNSMSMSGISAPSSMYKRAMGISQFTSYSNSSLRGAAVVLMYKGLKLSSLVDFPWLKQAMGGVRPERFTMMPAANLSWYSKHSQIGLTTMCVYGRSVEDARISLDARLCFKGVDIFSESAMDMMTGSIASAGGFSLPIGLTRIALLGRYYPTSYPKTFTGAVRAGTYSKDEAGVALSLQREKLILSADWYDKLSTGRHQIKILASNQFSITPSLTIKPRVGFRWRSGGEKTKTDIRSDFVLDRTTWVFTQRLNWLHGISNAWLTYSEYGFLRTKLSVYTRLSLFFVDNWDDRIYAYEREAPGNLSIPAYYGRGFRANLYCKWKEDFKNCRLKLYIATLWTAYPWNSSSSGSAKSGPEAPRSGSLSVNIQFSLEI